MPYFEIGISHPRSDENIGTLWRSAYQLGAAGIFTIGRPYKHQTSDVVRAEYQLPLRHYQTFEEFEAVQPVGAVLLGINGLRVERTSCRGMRGLIHLTKKLSGCPHGR